MCDPPFWISNIRLRYKIWKTAQRNFSASKYMVIDSGILQLCIYAELLVFPLLKLPSWISDFRLHHTVWEIAFSNSSTSETWEMLLEFFSNDVYSLRYKYFRFVSQHFGFLTLLASYSMGNIFIEFFNLGNMNFAVGILELCCIHAEIFVFPLWESPSWISDFRLQQTI